MMPPQGARVPLVGPIEHRIAVAPQRAGRMLDVGITTVYNLMGTGELPYIRIGRLRRIAVADLEKYVTRKQAELGTPATFKAVGGSR